MSQKVIGLIICPKSSSNTLKPNSITYLNISITIGILITYLNFAAPSSQLAITCSKLTIETLEQDCDMSHLCSSVSIVNFEQINASWVVTIA